MKIIELVSYTIPMFGDKRSFPYGRMVVEHGGVRKTVRFGEVDMFGGAYINFNRRRYYYENRGDLYNPVIVFPNKQPG